MTRREDVQADFLQAAGWVGYPCADVAGDASNRRYTRISKPTGQTAILMDAPPDRGEDVTPFVQIARHLTDFGFSAPLIYHQDTQNGFLLIEDLGDDLFARLIARNPAQALPLYTAATEVLIALHQIPVPSLPLADAAWLSDMIAPVFEWYVGAPDPAGIKRFHAAFQPLAQEVDTAPKVIALRDYHAENLLWLPNREGTARVGLLDFQDAVCAHPAYDLVSVLQDARRDVSPDIEQQMLQHYIKQTGAEANAFGTAYALLGVQRNLRILGIFARLCLRDGKAHYVDMIPRVWGYVIRNLSHPALQNVANPIMDILPPPTQDFLEHLKSRCPTPPKP